MTPIASPRLRPHRRLHRARAAGWTRPGAVDGPPGARRGGGAARGPRRHRGPGRRRSARRPDGAELVVLCRIPARPASSSLDGARRTMGGPSLAAAPSSTDVRQHQGADASLRPTPPACAASAAIRWRAASRPATAPPTADLFVDRPWVVVPGADCHGRADVALVERSLRRCGARPVAHGRRRPTTPRSRHQPPAAGRRRAAGRGGRRAGRRAGRPAGRGTDPRRAGLARHDPPGARRRRDGRRHRWRRTPRPVADALRDIAASLEAWLVEPRAVPAERPTRRPSRRGSRRARARWTADRERTRAAMPDVRASWRRSRTVPDWHWPGTDRPSGHRCAASRRSRSGAFRPAAEMEVDPACKQVIPYLVLRDGERYLPDATDAGRRRCAAARPLVDRRRRPPQPGRRRPLGRPAPRVARRSSIADFVPEFRLVGLLNDDTTDGRRRPPRRGLRGRRRRPARRDPRDRQARRGLREPIEVVDASPDRLETWSALAFEYPGAPAGVG